MLTAKNVRILPAKVKSIAVLWISVHKSAHFRPNARGHFRPSPAKPFKPYLWISIH
jgi:hypothetical protein